jgi:N-acetylmuramoyl-L-alanine amidase
VLLVVGGFYGWGWIRARSAKASALQTAELPGGREGQFSAANTMGSTLPISTIRFWSNDDSTSVMIELAHQVQFDAHRLTDPQRVYFDLQGTRLPDNERGKALNIEVAETLVRKIRVAEREPGVTRVVLETKGACEYSAVVAPNPYRFIVQIRPSQ